tara:strand:- start:506 stop:1423 length:918 start_codon:yes stop_codon:yes gene_type:complete
MKWKEIINSINKETIFLDMVKSECTIHKNEIVFTIGSCFVREIEERLTDLVRFPVLKYKGNEFETHAGRNRGILNQFTPDSMIRELLWAKNTIENQKVFEKETSTTFEYVIDDDNIIDIGLHMPLPITRDRFLHRRKIILDIYKEISVSESIIITVGNIENHFLDDGRMIESISTNKNFLKKEKNIKALKPAKYDLSCKLKELHGLLRYLNKEARIILTVSPIPMSRNDIGDHIIVENFYNKILLVDTVRDLCQHETNTFYFPSFEFVNFIGISAFKEDLRHIKTEIIDLIVNGFKKMTSLDINN